MEPIIQIDTPLDSLTLTGTNVAGGYIYDNDTLDGWFRLASVNVKFNKRPNAHGTYKPDQLFTNEARIPLTGKFFGDTPLAAAVARNRLAGLFSDGKVIMVTVTDDLGPTSRVCFVVSYLPEWMPDGNFSFSLELGAPDPRRYGTLQTPTNGLPSGSSGLVWPLGSSTQNILRTNLSINPGVEINTTGWSATAGTISRVTTEHHSGTASLQVITPGSGLAEGVIYTAAIAGMAGKTYSDGIWIKAPVGALLYVVARTSGGAAEDTPQTPVTGTGAWQFAKAEGKVAQADATTVQIQVRTRSGAQALTFYVDDGIIEEAPTMAGSFDGDTASTTTLGYAWLGTPGASASTQSNIGPTALYWDWGTPGNSGRVTITNRGNTTSYPAFLAGAGGSLSAGFVITEVQTGRTIIYPVDTAGAVIRLDSRTQRVTIGPSDLTGNLSRDEWFAVPPGAAYEYQFATLGATTGVPTLQLLGADAYL